jgi:hypothetical protein
MEPANMDPAAVAARLDASLAILKDRYPKKTPQSEFCRIANGFFERYKDAHLEYTHGTSGIKFRVSSLKCIESRGFSANPSPSDDAPTSTIYYTTLKWVALLWGPGLPTTWFSYVPDQLLERVAFAPQIDTIEIKDNYTCLSIKEGDRNSTFRVIDQKV